MLNVQSLTNTMSRMTLPQLQQYAALHKDDPYVVSLALSIANQKKQADIARAGQAGMMPQPKVVDQQIADMAAVDPMGNVTGAQALPEDIGIGRLPAQNLRRMAGGGIVADSVPEKEFQETINKSRALIKAVEMAEKGF